MVRILLLPPPRPSLEFGHLFTLISLLNKLSYADYIFSYRLMAHQGYTRLVELLLKNEKFSVDVDDFNMEVHMHPPVYDAAAGGHSDILQMLMQHGADIYRVLNGYPHCALEGAILGRSETCFDLLIKEKDVLSKCHKVNYWPLLSLTRNGSPRMVKELVPSCICLCYIL